MKSMKKTLSCLLALTIATSMFAMPVYAEDEQTDEAATAVETVETPETPASDADVEFQIEGTKLVKYNGTAEEVVVPYGVTVIGKDAFRDNETITKVTLPDSVTELEQGYLYQWTWDYYRGAFFNCSSLKYIDLGKGLKSIGDNSFNECTALETVIFPEKLTSIGSKAFRGCKKLASLDLSGTSVTTVGANAFEGCTSARITKLPDTLTDLGEAAYVDCTALALCTLSNNLKVIKKDTFRNTGLLKITIPDSVTEIEDGYDYNWTWWYYRGAFSDCPNLGEVIFGKNLTKIGKNTFSQCKKLSKVSALPIVLETIGERAFEGCSELSSLGLANTNLKSIGSRAFANCQKIDKAVIPDTVISIGKYAFNSCSNLKSVTLPNTIDTLEEGVFGYCSSLPSIVIPDSVKTIADGTQDYDANSGVFQNCTSLKSVTFGKGLETIGRYAFYNCTVLGNVTMPDNIKKIKSYAFSTCTGLKSVSFGTGVEDIENYAFENCSALAGIVMPVLMKTFVSPRCFDGCTSLSSYDLGNSLVTIECNFSECEKLTTLNISKTLMSINGNSFEGSPNISEIYYSGTKSEWGDLMLVNQDSNLYKMQDKFCVHCTDGDIPGANYVKKSISSISLKLPEKLEYTIGEPLDVTGGLVNITYSDKSKGSVPLTVEMCSGFDSSKAGTKTVTVTYEGKTTTFKVTIKKGETPVECKVTLDGTPVESISKALSKLKSGEHTIVITSSFTEKTITIPKKLTKVTIICDGGVTLTTNTITANSPLVLDDVTLAGVNSAKPTVIKANSDFSANSGNFGNITVKGKAQLADITVNGNLALSAKADKEGKVTDTLERIKVTGKVSSNNNVEFVDCPSIGTVNVKGLVTITGEDGTKAVAVTSGAKTGVCTIEGLEVEKKLSVAADLSAYNLTANNAVDVKGNAVIEQSNIAGKLAVAKNLTAEGISVNGAVDVKGNAVIDFSTIIGKLNVKGILTVNSDVRVENAVTCAELNSTKGAELTAISLAVTKNGVSAESGEITLTLIDKYGGEVSPKPDKKGVITVSKKFKDSKTKAKEFDVPALKFNNNGTICSLKCVSGKLVVSA